MTFPLSPEAAGHAVLWGALCIGLVLGVAAQISRFCTMGALTDFFAYGGVARLLMWLMAIAVAAAGVQTLVSLDLVDATKTLAWSSKFLWLSYAVGGLVFGFGMVLASGCPQRNLVRAGSGNLKSLVTLLVAAVSAQMTLRGVFAIPRAGYLDTFVLNLASPQDWGSLLSPYLDSSPLVIRWAIVGLMFATTLALVYRHRSTLLRSHWVGGIAVGLLVPLALLLTGYVGFIAEHPETLEPAWLGTSSHRPELLTFAAPIAHTVDLLTLWSDRSNTVTYGVLVALGVLLGSAVSSALRKEFRWESFAGTQDMAHHLLGGVLMGIGGVTAMGCSIGQGVSGLAMLSAGAVLAVFGIVVGSWAGFRYQSSLL